MKRTMRSEEQIIGMLKQAEAGSMIADLARRNGVSEAIIYNGKANYGGLGDIRSPTVKYLESKNAKLKRLLVGAMLIQAASKDPLAKMF